MSNKRTIYDGTEVVFCDMCGHDGEKNAFESFDGMIHVCYKCVRRMFMKMRKEMNGDDREL